MSFLRPSSHLAYGRCRIRVDSVHIEWVFPVRSASHQCRRISSVSRRV